MCRVHWAQTLPTPAPSPAGQPCLSFLQGLAKIWRVMHCKIVMKPCKPLMQRRHDILLEVCMGKAGVRAWYFDVCTGLQILFEACLDHGLLTQQCHNSFLVCSALNSCWRADLTHDSLCCAIQMLPTTIRQHSLVALPTLSCSEMSN